MELSPIQPRPITKQCCDKTVLGISTSLIDLNSPVNI